MSSPIFRQLNLRLEKQTKEIEDILLGRSSIAVVAEALGQDGELSFYADGDILIIEGEPAHQPLIKNSKSKAKDAVKDKNEEIFYTGTSTADVLFREKIIPAVTRTQQSIELVVRQCELSIETICLLAEAIRENKSLVGFNVEERKEDEVAMAVLKHACINTLAPIQWFQGQQLPENIVEARENLVAQRKMEKLQVIPTIPRPSTPSTTNQKFGGDGKKVQFIDLPQAHDDDKASKKKLKPTFLKAKDNVIYWNEREIWTYQMKEQLKSLHNSEELEQILSSLELYELQIRIDDIVSDRNVWTDSYSRWSLNGSIKGKFMVNPPHLV